MSNYPLDISPLKINSHHEVKRGFCDPILISFSEESSRAENRSIRIPFNINLNSSLKGTCAFTDSPSSSKPGLFEVGIFTPRAWHPAMLPPLLTAKVSLFNQFVPFLFFPYGL